MSQSDVKPPPSYRGLLALVIILGVLIVFGVVALIAGIAMRIGNRAPSGAAYAANVPAPGERIESTQLDGNRILVRLSGPNGEELVLLDAASGRVIGRIAINSRP